MALQLHFSVGYGVYRTCKENWYNSVLHFILSVIWVCSFHSSTERNKHKAPFRNLCKEQVYRKPILRSYDSRHNKFKKTPCSDHELKTETDGKRASRHVKQPNAVDTGGLHGPRGLRPANPKAGPGLDLVAQIILGSRPGSGLVQMIAIKSCIKHFGISAVLRPSFFRKKKVIRSCAHLMFVKQSG
jgi:hypothetical protein